MSQSLAWRGPRLNLFSYNKAHSGDSIMLWGEALLYEVSKAGKL